MKHIIFIGKVMFLFVAVTVTSVLGFFGIGKSGSDVEGIFGGFDLGENAYADHTLCGPGVPITSTCQNSDGSAGDGSAGCADGDGDGGDSDGGP